MPFKYKPNASSVKPPPIDESGNAFGGDIVSTTDTNAASPISAGYFRIEKGKPLVFEYEFDEAKLFLEGECVVEDETGQKVTARSGDVFLFTKGSKISFSTSSYALAFYCDQRAKL
ncbi:unnamed protein product [Clonostachys rosea f. rosea IK726]|uniref:Uncharacterized protein n=1 Tax=Clonostachys rosea f. rosea IK726 TaxID=1349383 RepID=A0ACA9T5Y2_BIOOC|nr:unnamed protein product [Clonostachys rosea f. rosea IK726]